RGARLAALRARLRRLRGRKPDRGAHVRRALRDGCAVLWRRPATRGAAGGGKRIACAGQVVARRRLRRPARVARERAGEARATAGAAAAAGGGRRGQRARVPQPSHPPALQGPRRAQPGGVAARAAGRAAGAQATELRGGEGGGQRRWSPDGCQPRLRVRDGVRGASVFSSFFSSFFSFSSSS
ncbi:unnamed protein product, partial [Prorocentrum cordatum]